MGLRIECFRVSRLVVLPDYQGIGVGKALLNFIAEYYSKKSRLPFFLTTSNPQLARAKMHNWHITRAGHTAKQNMQGLRKAQSANRLTVTLRYIPKRTLISQKLKK